MNKLYYRITKSVSVDGYYNLDVYIPKSEALNEFDSGRVSRTASSKETIIYDLISYENLGYTLVRESDILLQSLYGRN